jgi:TolB-like protein
MLTLERKIKVSGSWINQDGEKLLWASRIDLL